MRLLIAVAAAVIAAMSPVVVLAQSAPPPAAQEAPKPDSKPAEVPKTYLPGLEVFMGTIQRQHEKLWFAGRARNWELTAYQLGEMKEVMGVVQDLVPKYKELPIADMIDAVITGPIVEMEKAIESKNYRGFVASFDKITAACNSCHEGAERGFIKLRRPVHNPYSNQVFRLAK